MRNVIRNFSKKGRVQMIKKSISTYQRYKYSFASIKRGALGEDSRHCPGIDASSNGLRISGNKRELPI